MTLRKICMCESDLAFVYSLECSIEVKSQGVLIRHLELLIVNLGILIPFIEDAVIFANLHLLYLFDIPQGRFLR